MSIQSACCCGSAARGARACPREGGGSARHAVATAARPAVCLVAGGPAARHVAAARPAVPGTQPGRTALDPPPQPRRPRRRRGRRDQEAGVATYVAAQLRHAPAGTGYRHPCHPEPAPAKAGVLLGHAKLDTTALCTRVANTTIRAVISPLDRLGSLSREEPRQRVSPGGGEPPEAGGRGRLSSPWGAWRRANTGRVSLGQLKVMAAISTAARLPSGAMSSAARIAATAGSPTTRAVIAIAPSARACPREGGGRGSKGLARRTQDRSATGRLLPPSLHAARRDCSNRLSEQGGGLRPAVPRGVRDAAHNRCRSPAPGRPHRRHRRAPQLGLGNDPPSACAYDRAGRRNIARWYALVPCRPGFLLPVRALSRLFRRPFLALIADAHTAGRLAFFGELD